MPYWDVSLVTDMQSLFSGKRSFNADISRWDVSSVTNMYRMFKDAWAFNQHLSRWDVSSVTHMGYMFASAKAFNTMPDSWDTSSVTQRGVVSGGSGPATSEGRAHSELDALVLQAQRGERARHSHEHQDGEEDPMTQNRGRPAQSPADVSDASVRANHRSLVRVFGQKMLS